MVRSELREKGEEVRLLALENDLFSFIPPIAVTRSRCMRRILSDYPLRRRRRRVEMIMGDGFEIGETVQRRRCSRLQETRMRDDDIPETKG